MARGGANVTAAGMLGVARVDRINRSFGRPVSTRDAPEFRQFARQAFSSPRRP